MSSYDYNFLTLLFGIIFVLSMIILSFLYTITLKKGWLIALINFIIYILFGLLLPLSLLYSDNANESGNIGFAGIIYLLFIGVPVLLVIAHTLLVSTIYYIKKQQGKLSNLSNTTLLRVFKIICLISVCIVIITNWLSNYTFKNERKEWKKDYFKKHPQKGRLMINKKSLSLHPFYDYCRK